MTTREGLVLRCSIRNAFILLAGALVLTAPLLAQLQVGDNLNLRLNGTLSAGYNGDYGNQTSSDHSIGLGGTGTASGYYYSPNFLAFSATPYYNQARDNSSYRSISDASGVDAQTTLFGGSNFPGSISYSKSYNSEGNYAVPGLANYTTNSSSDTFGISWSEHVPHLPTLSASFQTSGGHNSIYGTGLTADSSSHSFNLNSSYNWKGFGLGASYYTGASNSQFPEILAGEQQVSSTDSTDHGYTFTASHKLPWNGSAFCNYSNQSVNTSFEGESENYSVGTFNAAASFQPTQKFHASFSMSYSNNLSGSIDETVLASGGVVSQSIQSPASHAYDFAAGAGYVPLPFMQVQASAERRTQDYLGNEYGSNTYSGAANYWHAVLGGNFNTSLSVADTTVDGSSDNSLGLNINTNFNRRFGAWIANGNFNYSQNAETLLVTYTTSQYGYGGGLRRRWGKVSWSLNAGANRSGLTGLSGTTNQSESASSGISYGHWANLGVSYSQSSGNGILTGTGVVTVPVPSPVLPAGSGILFGGHSYSVSVGSSPARRLTISAAYAKSDSSTGSGLTGSTNTTSEFNTLVQYQFRKMYLTGGFSQLTQGFTASGTVPQTISSFYIGVSRWFNFF